VKIGANAGADELLTLAVRLGDQVVMLGTLGPSELWSESPHEPVRVRDILSPKQPP